MNEKIGTWTLSLLLALLLASVPTAATDLGPNPHLIPELKVNESIETIAISGELSVQPELGVTAEGAFGIPFGSIVVHTADRTTLVFDSDGNHLFSISDERSTKIPTPAGVEKPCTWVNQIPSGSQAHYCGNTTFVFGAVGEPILTVIDEHQRPVEDPITISITSPSDGDDIWIDAVPPHITVAGEVHAPLGVRSVNILSGTEEIRCGNGTTFACSVPVSAGENTITVQVRDNRRRLVEKTVNVTVYIGRPPPSVTVTGMVTDREGSPVSGASVRFASAFTLGGELLSVTTATGDDGGYLIEDAPGYRQTVTVEKEGYSPLRREVVFENLTNELNLELDPSSRTIPGFGLVVGVLSLMGALLILLGRK